MPALLCPSCDRMVGAEGICGECGARYDGRRWFYDQPQIEEGEEIMTGAIADPDPKNYFFCETCSTEEKERVVYPKRALKARKAWFLDSDKTEKLTCPYGHDVVPEAPAVPA